MVLTALTADVGTGRRSDVTIVLVWIDGSERRATRVGARHICVRRGGETRGRRLWLASPCDRRAKDNRKSKNG